MGIGVTFTDTTNLEAELAKMPLALRGKYLSRALKAVAGIVVDEAKRLCPQPGYPGDNPEFKPLRDTITSVVREYSNSFSIFIGPSWPAGAHGHLVEFGHRTASGQTAPHPFLRPAADNTKAKQAAELDAAIKRAVEEMVTGIRKRGANGRFI